MSDETWEGIIEQLRAFGYHRKLPLNISLPSEWTIKTVVQKPHAIELRGEIKAGDGVVRGKLTLTLPSDDA